jgi:hypothetical protein
MQLLFNFKRTLQTTAELLKASLCLKDTPVQENRVLDRRRPVHL